MTKQKRELRRLREEEIKFGFGVLSREYLNCSEENTETVFKATKRVTEASSELIRNPNETLMLQALLLDLPALG